MLKLRQIISLPDGTTGTVLRIDNGQAAVLAKRFGVWSIIWKPLEVLEEHNYERNKETVSIPAD